MGLRIVDLDQRSDAWLKWRIGVYTASRSAAILGESNFQTAYDVWLEMTGRQAGFDGNKATERGTELEGPAKAAYEMHNGFIETIAPCILHPTYDFIGASLDAIDMLTMIPAELKYPSQKSHDMALAGEVPRHYWIQVQHQLMCIPDAPYAHYWSHRDDNPKQIQVEHDMDFQKTLLDAICAFRELVISDVPPPLTPEDAKWVDDPQSHGIADALIQLKESEDGTKKAKEQMDELKALLVRLAGHSKVRCGRVLVSHSLTKAGKDSYRLTVAGLRDGA